MSINKYESIALIYCKQHFQLMSILSFILLTQLLLPSPFLGITVSTSRLASRDAPVETT